MALERYIYLLAGFAKEWQERTGFFQLPARGKRFKFSAQ